MGQAAQVGAPDVVDTEASQETKQEENETPEIVQLLGGLKGPEKGIKIFVLEWSPVNQFMYGIYGKRTYSSVQESSKETNSITKISK